MPVGGAMAAALPTVTTPVVAPLPLAPGASETVKATVTADPLSPGVTIVSASFTVNGTPGTMTADDGAFDGASEAVTGTFTAPATGAVKICVTGTDSAAGTSVPVCVDLVVDTFPPDVTSIRVVTDAEGNATFTATVDDTKTGGSNIASVAYTFDGGTEVALTIPTGLIKVDVSGDLGVIGAAQHKLCIIGTDTAGNVDDPVKFPTKYCIIFDTYTFKGFLPPIRMDVANKVTAPRTIPIKWWLLKADGKPAAKANLFSMIQVMSYKVDCSTGTGDPASADKIGSPGKTGLKNLGGGRWQINWKTQKDWRGTCRKMFVAIGDLTPGSKAFSSVQFTPEVQFDFRDNGKPKK